MAFWKKWFCRCEKTGENCQEEMRSVINQKYLSSVCEVKTLGNILVATGMIRELSEDAIQLDVRAGKPGNFPKGLRVKLSIFNSKLGFLVVRGVISESSKEHIRIVELCPILSGERRNFFRVEISMFGNIMVLAREDGKGLGLFEEPEHDPYKPDEYYYKSVKIPARERSQIGSTYQLLRVQLRDISIGGVQFCCPYLFEGGEIWLELKIDRVTLPFHCIVRRIGQEAGEVYYGCEFLDMDQNTSDLLCKFILQRQQEQLAH